MELPSWQRLLVNRYRHIREAPLKITFVTVTGVVFPPMPVNAKDVTRRMTTGS